MTLVLALTRKGLPGRGGSSEAPGVPPAGVKQAWDEEDHPRGRDGRFIRKGDRVRLPDGRLARVVGSIAGQVALERDDGGRVVRPAGDLTQAAPVAYASGDRVRLAGGEAASVVMVTTEGTLMLRTDSGKPRRALPDEVSPVEEPGTAEEPQDAPFAPEDYYSLPDPKINDSEEASLKFYRGNGYQEINRQLRENEGELDEIDDREIAGHIKALDRAIARNKLESELVVYRGLSQSYMRDMTPGAEVDVLAFSSTSLSRDKAAEFAEGGPVLRIVLPKGTPALKAFDGDFEILLGRGMELEVERVEDGTVHVKVV